MENKKKLTSIVTLLVIVLSFSFCSVSCAKDEPLKTEDFHYRVNNDQITVLTLTLEGREKEEIIIPPYVDGKEVQVFSEMRSSPVATTFPNIRSDQLVNFYAPYTLMRIDGYGYNTGTFIKGEKLEKVFYPSNKLFFSTEFIYEAYIRIFNYQVNNFVTVKSWNYLIKKYSNDDFLKKVFPANVSYLFNYENSPNNNYYFIDNAEELSLVRNAPAPTREGYEFGGWYKESECLNKWNFETDITPVALFDENGKEVYQETKLYAKWDKK